MELGFEDGAEEGEHEQCEATSNQEEGEDEVDEILKSTQQRERRGDGPRV
jgi:hypothetical protein